MNIIDTHTHLYLPEFDENRQNVIKRAENEGIRFFLLPAIDSDTHEQMLKLEIESSGSCKAMMGVHPCSIKEDFREELRVAKEFLHKQKFIAVGEIGLDFYWDKTFTDQQFIAFHEQIEWAMDLDLPIVIHSRNSIEECISVVKEHQNGKLNGVFHCFSGTAEQAKKVIDLGFYLGIGGVLTFKNSGLDNAINEISLDHMLLETDAPYLAPVPFRGKRNEPSYLKYVIKKLSELKKISEDIVAEKTTANAKKLFKLN